MVNTNLTKEQQKEVKEEVKKQVKEEEKRVEKRLHKQLIEKTSALSSEFKKQTSTAMIAAFGFLIALVWRDLIQKIVQENTKLPFLSQYPYLALLYTAVIITVIAIIGIALISRWAKTPETK